MTETIHYIEDLEALVGRSDSDQLHMMHTAIHSLEHLQYVIDAMPLAILVLNSHRQIVAANAEILSMVGWDIESILGSRPGELVGCTHANDGPDGCGTGPYCRVCGAVNALVNCLEACEKQSEECQITLNNGQSLDWKVCATPLKIGDELFLMAAVEDISDNKRRSALERIFFHDIINLIGAIVGFSQMILEEHKDDEEITEIVTLANELLEEVQSHRDLTLAERGDLQISKNEVHLHPFLQRVGQIYQNHPVAEGRDVLVDIPEDLTVETDSRLLKRVIGNMIKNALEASDEGQAVRVFSSVDEGRLSLNVRNHSVMDDKTKLKIFNRSFSTKGGAGRGIGTYSMKLLGEKYLGGEISFVSEPDTGTIFTLTLPA